MASKSSLMSTQRPMSCTTRWEVQLCTQEGKIKGEERGTIQWNLQGSRIRNPQQDLLEYRRIAARTLHEKERKESEELKKKTKKKQDMVNERNIKPNKSVSRNTTITESESIIKLSKQSLQTNSERITECDSNIQVVVLDEAHENNKRIKHRQSTKMWSLKYPYPSEKAVSFHKLGLFKGSKKEAASSPWCESIPKHRTELSCSDRTTSQNSENRPKSAKKIQFLKRIRDM